MTAAVTAAVATGVPRRLGASRAEARIPLPGDELLPEAGVQNDRARTLAASPARVWPWIAQLGQDKAGFYSFETLENLAGCRITGADRVHPEWQDVRPGDIFRLHPDVALRVARVEPGRCLVVTSQGGDAPGEMDFATTWTFHLTAVESPTGVPSTRLHLRERYETRGASARVMIEATSVVSALMTWRMLARLAALTTATPEPPSRATPAR
ncbi:hypothetical protein [Nocardia puris]|uniref:Polyketide cyclase/dehydrase/lipid transport protein n=1 Tax=Nocardia puris TaxID=208602 RepID=A0A366CZ42_9NOCA|nr:hypothetical protein [Nocardia puris]RBO82976.1 hypothetical protein DFR74_12166 [Nocardia puris]